MEVEDVEAGGTLVRARRCCQSHTSVAAICAGCFDALTVLASAADMVTDILVLINFWLDGQMGFATASLCIILLAQITFAVIFTIERTDISNMRATSWQALQKRVIVFMCVFPFAQLFPILAYVTSTFDVHRLQHFLTSLGVGGSSTPRPEPNSEWERVKNKIHAHRGFLLEAFAEAIPQCALQLIAALTVGHFSTLSALSIFLSILVIASKSWVVAYSPHVPTMVFNALCIVADIIGFFAILAWLFAEAELPRADVMHTSLRDYLFGTILVTLLCGAACLASFTLGMFLDELRFQSEQAEKWRREGSRPRERKTVWLPPALLPLFLFLGLVPVGMVYLLARWTVVALACGTLGQEDKVKVHREAVGKLMAYIERGDPLVEPLRLRRVSRYGPLVRDPTGMRQLLPPDLPSPLPADTPTSLARCLREHAVQGLLRATLHEYKDLVQAMPKKARKEKGEQPIRQLLGKIIAQAGHYRPPRASAGIIQRLPVSSTTATAPSGNMRRDAAPALADGGVETAAAQAEVVDDNLGRGVDSRTLRWMMLVLMLVCPCYSATQRANARVTLQFKNLGPCSLSVGESRWGYWRGALQIAASGVFAFSMVLLAVWTLLTLPLVALSMLFPFIEPAIYYSERASATGEEALPPPPVLALVLSICLGACVIALVPLRLSRRRSRRIQLFDTLWRLSGSSRLSIQMLQSIQARCDAATSAAVADVAVGGSVNGTATQLHHRVVRQLRFDDDCIRCHHKVQEERGVRIFLEAAFLGPSAYDVTRGSTALPHLPEPIRQQIYEMTRAGCQSSCVVLGCGHRLHQRCWNLHLGPHSKRGRLCIEEPRERTLGSSAQQIPPELDPTKCPECNWFEAQPYTTLTP
eukprot:CAMPEP_0115864330 /NCGR_PEP_ID=MMETSP0287-20121206/19146_1 /TAXON_ID=412157 /ORGANISM="Chrysochromulina rotalis, Strain UIO044" /LENGTH=867 /DNA_ID=CAMNT_0003318799 /DNA_START=26 /DNA_END=2629 /DNA_ORIENTATION=-